MSTTTTPEPRPHQLPAGLTASLEEHVLVRDQYACFRCGLHSLEGRVWVFSRRPGKGNAEMPVRMAVCNDCITDITSPAHRRRSIRLGYLIPADNFNPAAIPVLHHRNGWVVLTQDGKWAKADEFAVRDWEARWES